MMHVTVVALCCLSSTAMAADDQHWMVRGRVIYSDPNESSTITPIGGQAKISNEIAPEVDVSYFFDTNWAIEVPLGGVKHQAKAVNTIFGTVDSGQVLSTPASIWLQYHVTELSWAKPYAGLGLAYAMYTHEKDGVTPNLDVKNDLGWGWQAGVDVPIAENWYWNADVKKIYVSADARWSGSPLKADIDLNPWIVGTGFGYRF
jgi:outer membrane protein